MAETLTVNPTLFTVPTDTAQVETITLTGTSGTAEVTLAGGLTKTVTFNTDLTQTAADFDTDHSAAYTAEGITITSSGGDIIFTATVAGVPFTAPVITNLTGDLDGTVDHTTANASKTGEIDFTTVLPKKSVVGFTGNALIQWLSGTTKVAFSVNNEAIDTDSGIINANNTKIILPLIKDVNLKYEGNNGGETFNITITD